MTGSVQMLIVGSGLRGCLTALALAERCPDLDFLLVEQSGRFGGGPVPPFFASSGEAGALVAPMVVAEWPNFYLALPDISRRVDGAIAWLVPEQIHADIVERLPPERYRLGTRCVSLRNGRAAFEDGSAIDAPFILDARGAAEPDGAGESWCHVAARTFEFAAPHGLDRPVLIDATLAVQGWSFLQYVPIGPTRLMIRYLRHSDSRAAIPVADRSGLNEAGTLIEEDVAAWRISGRRPVGYRRGGATALVRAEAGSHHPLLPSPVPAAARFAIDFAAEAARRPGAPAKAWFELEARRFGQEQHISPTVEALGGAPLPRAAALRHIAAMTASELARLSG